MELTVEAHPKMAFSIGQGLQKFKVILFGLCNTPATLGHLMEKVLPDVPHSRYLVYLDNVLAHTYMLFSKPSTRQGSASTSKKCVLFQRKTFLGHHISGEGGN